MLKAILFDLDDTLLDWRGFNGDWPALERQYLKRVFDYVSATATPLADFDRFVESFHHLIREAWRHGRGTLIAPNLGTILMQTLVGEGVPRGAVELDAVLDAYNWRAVPGTELFPEVIDSMKLIRQHGIKTAIVTNASQPMRLRDVELADLGLLEYFPDFRIAAADAGVLKPHPEIFNITLRALNIKPEEAVFVGDNPIADVAGAQAVGMQAVLRVTTPVPAMLSGLIIPDAAINTMAELPGVLDNWFPDWRPIPA